MNKSIMALSLLVAGVAGAHHSYSAFDMNRNVTFEGVVTNYDFANPHVHFTLKVPKGATDPATEGTWDVEGASTSIMRKQGWTKTTLKPGDKVKLVGRPMRDGAKGMALFYLIQPDGSRLYMDIARPKDGQ